ncbi:hypothetical protein [Helicobacter pylori]|uniref:hypothetical protein n=1 Tax=Helicobacter pylori TaxID=210 RepID=UPI00026B2AC8|nr:hypothetical protein [Helicobacter pylori]EJC14645.1 hypothetical protein HPHPP25_1226 [Helicobacter pylori Hp P-25]EJC34521.1 hypothetical protein HPHPP25C_1088 [Helicobacter pylori Hp P-25c]EJC36799.1 hypothetical protein HPHPP25D_1275 [Helicobacter pylori Hp P-25d]EMH22477.1 hypothetical protein HMPREF1417_00032 [Helicobacter pylori GAM260Bi]EMH26341.1 hypothetical protein HMPREF1419_00138 [Helicobacter pylori GAM263BFi]
MLEALNALNQLNALHSKNAAHHFNATLPILLKVLEKQDKDLFLLQVGNKIIPTKSEQELKINQPYFAVMQRNQLGDIVLKNLVPAPKILDALDDLPAIEMKKLKEILSAKDNTPLKEYKEFLSEKLIHAKSSQEFLNTANMLLSLQSQVLSFVIENERKKAFLQMKAKKQSVDFYALYPNLGEIGGVIYLKEKEKQLFLKTTLQRTKEVLKEAQNTLLGFSFVEIVCEKTPMLFAFEERLLDTLG